MRALVAFDVGVEAPDVGQQLPGLALALGDDAIYRTDRRQHRRGSRDPQCPGDTARDKVGQHGVQPTHGLGPQPGEVVVAVGQHAQDDGVVVGRDGVEATVAQGGHGGGQGVVGVILLRLARAEHPHARRQRRRNVDHVLAGRDQLLGQQVAQATGGLDGPPPLREPFGPLEELDALAPAGPDLQLAQEDFVAVDGHGRVRAFVGIHADQHLHGWLPLSCFGMGAPRRALLMGKVLSPLSSHAAAGHWRAGGSLRSHTPGGGQALQEPTRQMPRTLRVETLRVRVKDNHQALPGHPVGGVRFTGHESRTLRGGSLCAPRRSVLPHTEVRSRDTLLDRALDALLPSARTFSWLITSVDCRSVAQEGSSVDRAWR